ncbi:MAG: hypothetical protein IT262_00615 [Saprospiraceae bacterium]|nr:hypothetical protein [Saprospiraceae bacterium]
MKKLLSLFLLFCAGLHTQNIFAQAEKPTLMDAPCNAAYTYPYNWSFSDELNKVVSFPVSDPTSIFIWDFNSQRVRKIISVSGTESYFPLVVWKKNGEHFYYIKGHHIVEYDFESGAPVAQYEAPFPIDFATKIPQKEQLLIGAVYGNFELLDIQTLRPVKNISSNQEKSQNNFVVSSNGKYFAQPFADNMLHIIDLGAGTTCLTTPNVSFIAPFAFTKDNQQIVVSTTSSLQFYDLKSGEIKRELKAPQQDQYRYLQFSADGRFLVVTGKSSYICDLQRDKVVFSGKGQKKAFFFQNDELLCLAGDNNYDLNIYDFKAIAAAADARFGPVQAPEKKQESQNARPTQQEPSMVKEAIPGISPGNYLIQSDFQPLEVITASQQELAFGPYSDGIRTNDTCLAFRYSIWDRRAKKMTHRFATALETISVNAFSPLTNDLILLNESPHQDGYNQYLPYHLNLLSDLPAKPLFSEPRIVIGTFFKGKEALVAHVYAYKSRTNLRLLDLNKQKDIQDLELFKYKEKQGNGISSVHFINNGQKLLLNYHQMDSVEFQHTVFSTFDIKTGKMERINKKTDFKDTNGGIQTAISERDRYFAEPNLDKQVVVFNINSKELEFVIPQDEPYLYSLQFSFDETMLFIEGESKIKLYSVQDKKLMNQFRGKKPAWRPGKRELVWLDQQLNALLFSNLEQTDTFKLAAPHLWHYYYFDGTYLLVALTDGTLLKISADSHQITHTQQYSTFQKGVYLPQINMGKGYFFVRNRRNSGLEFYSLDNLERLCAYHTLTDEDWVVVAESGHFDGSANALKRMYFSDGKSTKTLDQFPAFYRRKGLLSYLLSGKRLEQMDLAKAFSGN